MPRRLLAAAGAALAAGAAVLAAGGQAVAAGPQPLSGPPTVCVQPLGITINSLVFDPAEVAPGGSSEAVLTATNCTGVEQKASETWTGRWLSATSTGLPSGCPVIDPLARQVDFGPDTQVSTSTGYTVPAGCTADTLRVTVTINVAGTQVDQASADLVIAQPGATPA